MRRASRDAQSGLSGGYSSKYERRLIEVVRVSPVDPVVRHGTVLLTTDIPEVRNGPR